MSEARRGYFVRLEFIGGVSRKFWETDIEFDFPTNAWQRCVRWGRIGTKGGAGNYKHGELMEALQAQDRAVREKLDEGYWLVEDTRARQLKTPYSLVSAATSSQIRRTSYATTSIPREGSGSFGVSLAPATPRREPPLVRTPEVEEPRERSIKLEDD